MDIGKAGQFKNYQNFRGMQNRGQISFLNDKTYPPFDKEIFAAFNYTINQIPRVASTLNSYGIGFKTIQEHFTAFKTYNNQIEYQNEEGTLFIDFSYDDTDKKNPVFNAHYHLPNVDLYVTYSPAEKRTTSYLKEGERDVQIITSFFNESENRFYEQRIIPVSGDSRAEINLKLYKNNRGEINLANAEITGTVIKNKRGVLKITDVYNENGNLKFKQVEAFYKLPGKDAAAPVKFRFAENNPGNLDLSEFEFRDNFGKTWVERSFLPQDKSLNKFYKLKEKTYSRFLEADDNTTMFVPYGNKNNYGLDYFINEKFNCGKADLYNWFKNIMYEHNPLFNIPALEIDTAYPAH